MEPITPYWTSYLNERSVVNIGIIEWQSSLKSEIKNWEGYTLRPFFRSMCIFEGGQIISSLEDDGDM